MSPILPHVTYVTPDAGAEVGLGDLLASLMQRPGEVALLVAGALGLLVALALDLRFRPLAGFRRALVDRAESYLGLVPWMLRLSLGLPLIGAGVLRYPFAPDVALEGFPYLTLTALGFLLLLGLASRLAAAAVLAIAVVLTLSEPRLFQIVELPFLALAVLLVGGGIPGADDLLASAVRRRHAAPPSEPLPDAVPAPDLRPRVDVLALVVRVGLGLSLLAAGLTEKLFDPGRAQLAVDKYQLTQVVPVSGELWITAAGLTEAALGAAILLGLWTRLSASLAFAVLSLTLFALPDDPVLAHVTLFGACSVLVVTGSGRFGLDRWRVRAVGPRGSRRAADEVPAGLVARPG